MILLRNLGILIFILNVVGCVTPQKSKSQVTRPWQRPTTAQPSNAPATSQRDGLPSTQPTDADNSVKAPQSALDQKNHTDPQLPESRQNQVRVTGAKTPVIEQSSECMAVPGYVTDMPFYLPLSKVFVTKITKSCTTIAGERGVLKGSGFIAMGLPCTGGDGRIDWKGTNYLAPKMLSFLVDTNCPIYPTDPQTAKQMITKELGLPADSTLLALNPFSIQYWEIQGHDDADVSFAIEVRSTKGIGTSWQAFQKETPYRVLLVGRENAFGQGKHLFVFEAEIKPSIKNRFRTNVIQGRVLNPDEAMQIKARCLALKPDRDCAAVF